MSLSKRLAEIAKEKGNRDERQTTAKPLHSEYPLLAEAMRAVDEDGHPKRPMKVGFYYSLNEFRVRLSDPESGLVAFFTLFEPTRLLEEIERKLVNPDSLDWRPNDWNGKFSS